MDRRTVTAVVLSLFIYYGWLVIRGGPPVDTDADPAMVATAVVDAPQVAPVVPVHTDIAVEQIPFESCGFEGVITNDGGGLRDITLPGSVGPYEVNPLYSWVLGLLTGGETNWKPYGDDPGPEILIGPNALALSAGSGDPAAPPTRFQVVSHGADGVVLQATDANGVNIRQVLSVAPPQTDGPCVFDVAITWSSDGAAVDQPLWVGMHDEVETSTGMFSHYSNSERPWAYVEDDLEYASFNERLEDGRPGAPVPIEGEATWFGLADRYFGLLVLPSEPGEAV